MDRLLFFKYSFDIAITIQASNISSIMYEKCVLVIAIYHLQCYTCRSKLSSHRIQ